MEQNSNEFFLVKLNVYDLQSNGLVHMIGLGAYHSGVVYRGSEWTFGEGGIGKHAIGKPDVVGDEIPLRQSIVMGTSKVTDFNEFQKILADLAKDFTEYDVTGCNCNHFSNALCQRLVGKKIPGWVNRTARVGNVLSNWFVSKKKKKEYMESQKKEQARQQLNQSLAKSQSQDREENLLLNMDLCHCINLKPGHDVKNLLNWKNTKSGIESNTDEQMLIYVPMSKKTTLTHISIRCNHKNLQMYPKLIKIFINRKDIDFQNVDDFKPQMTLTIDDPVQLQKNGMDFKLKRVHFKAVYDLTVFIEENHGADKTILQGMKFVGIQSS